MSKNKSVKLSSEDSLQLPPTSPRSSSPLGETTTPDGPEVPIATKKVARDPNMPPEAFNRDIKCIVTGVLDKDLLVGAQIYPYYMGPHVNSQQSKLWDHLKLFWPEDVVNAWHASLSQPSQTEVLENMITMSVIVHKAWDYCLFALKPRASQDQYTMELEFYWLKKSDGEKLMLTEELVTKPDFPSNLDVGNQGVKFHDMKTDAPLRSGHVITMRTTDPEVWPLPSKHLLDMKWHLNRIVAMSAAAIDDRGLFEQAHDDGNDDDDDGL